MIMRASKSYEMYFIVNGRKTDKHSMQMLGLNKAMYQLIIANRVL